jgi:DNA-binding NtrC family response regulator
MRPTPEVHRATTSDGGLLSAREISVKMKKLAPRVLVVDDEPLIRWSVTQALTGRGMAVTQAFDGASTLDRIAHTPPFDVIVLDLRMPDVSDLSLLESIRILSPSTAVVVMTAYGTAEMRQQAIGLGVRQLINKPFELADMAAAVEDAALHAA